MIEARIWMKKSDKNFLGKGRIELLEHIRSFGSIHAAAKAMKMSYKAAWDSVDAMNNLSDSPLVERVSGGKGGGGTVLTPKGEEIVKTFHIIEAKHQQFLNLFPDGYENIEAIVATLSRISLKLSARNQLVGTISAIKADTVNVLVELTVKGTDKIYATITQSSFHELGASIYDPAIAIIKASSVLIAKEPLHVACENTLKGTVINIISDSSNTEVTLELESKSTITATITNESNQELALEKGQIAYALFKASSVILGV